MVNWFCVAIELIVYALIVEFFAWCFGYKIKLKGHLRILIMILLIFIFTY
jgi:hypothetical protein